MNRHMERVAGNNLFIEQRHLSLFFVPSGRFMGSTWKK